MFMYNSIYHFLIKEIEIFAITNFSWKSLNKYIYFSGVRDELEYEKELKNTFISLLLSIQSKRRATSSSGSGGGSDLAPATSSLHQASRSNKGQSGPYKYLTTVIPYQPEKGSPSLRNLQVLVKILKAINEDSPAVPALLTDYILKVLCPS